MSAPAKKTVELFYDVISPYSWIGFEVLSRCCKKWDMTMNVTPIFMAGLFKLSENLPPGLHKEKLEYTRKDTKRMFSYYDVAYSTKMIDTFLPSEMKLFHGGNLPALRFITAVKQSTPEFTNPLTRQIFMDVWVNDKDMTQTDNIIQAGTEAGLSDAVIKDSLQKVKDPDIKQLLLDNTKAIYKKGAFGVPVILAEDSAREEQMFFGSDRFPQIAATLGKPYEGPPKAT